MTKAIVVCVMGVIAIGYGWSSAESCTVTQLTPSELMGLLGGEDCGETFSEDCTRPDTSCAGHRCQFFDNDWHCFDPTGYSQTGPTSVETYMPGMETFVIDDVHDETCWEEWSCIQGNDCVNFPPVVHQCKKDMLMMSEVRTVGTDTGIPCAAGSM